MIEVWRVLTTYTRLSKDFGVREEEKGRVEREGRKRRGKGLVPRLGNYRDLAGYNAL
jgi:hypothetical protein